VKMRCVCAWLCLAISHLVTSNGRPKASILVQSMSISGEGEVPRMATPKAPSSNTFAPRMSVKGRPVMNGVGEAISPIWEKNQGLFIPSVQRAERFRAAAVFWDSFLRLTLLAFGNFLSRYFIRP
jgi:hypothetical protein